MRGRAKERVGVLWLCVLALSCVKPEARAEAGGPARATLFVSADLWGYLAPCGCSENMRGGIARAAFQVAQARREGGPVLYVDGGDTLFGHLAPAEAQVPQEERKARALAEALKLMGVATWSPGERDDARGAELRRALALPEQPSGTARLLDLGGHKLGVAAALTTGELAKAARAARDQGARFVLGLLHQPIEEAQKVALRPEARVDLLVATHPREELAAEENRLARSAIPAVKIQSKGRSLLRVDLSFGSAGGPFELLGTREDAERRLSAIDQRIELVTRQVNAPDLPEQTRTLYRAKLAELVQRRQQEASAPPPARGDGNAFTVRFVPLDTSLPELPEVKAVVDAYDRDVATLNLEWARKNGKDCPPAKQGEAAFVGNEPCRECHAQAFPAWEGSKHEHAYATLVKAGKQYDLDCVRCHVLATGRPGAVCRVDRVEGRTSVGCESCHGPGSLHLEAPTSGNILARPGREQCVGCHNGEHSPHFDLATYLPRVLGKGHGLKPPLSKK